MGTICCKSDMPIRRKPFRFPPPCKTKCNTSIEGTPIHISEPVTLMTMPRAPSRSEVSESSLYYSCLTGKEAGLTLSRNSTSNNRLGSEERKQVSTGIIKLETKEMLAEESEMDSIEENSGFFEAHSFFKDDDEPTSTTIKEEHSPITEFKKSTTTFSTQRTMVSETNFEHGSPRQKHSEHTRWIKEIEDVMGQMKGVLEDNTVEYEKVYETERTLHKLSIYLNSYMDNEGYKRVRIKADWYMPCTPEDYIRYINSFEGLSEVIRNAEDFEQCDTFEDLEDHQFGVYYLCLPGLPYSKSKDFVMLKSFRKLGKDRWCDVFKSIDCDRHPEYEGRKRIKVIMGGHLAYKEADTEEKDKCKVQFYSEVQLDNTNSQNRTIKFLLRELEQYVERCVMNVNRFGLYHSEKTGLKNLDLLL